MFFFVGALTDDGEVLGGAVGGAEGADPLVRHQLTVRQGLPGTRLRGQRGPNTLVDSHSR